MVQAKVDLFSPDLIEQAALFKALSHPARLQILQFLANSSSCITGDISGELPLSRTTVNQHLKELKDLGLVKGHVEGVKTKYCLNPGKIELLNKLLTEFFQSIDTKNYKCE